MNRHAYFRQQEKNELYHHGIKGQKWGVRRYQNEDGTLTEEGKKRYGKNADYAATYKNDPNDFDVEKRLKDGRYMWVSKDDKTGMPSVNAMNAAKEYEDHYEEHNKIVKEAIVNDIKNDIANGWSALENESQIDDFVKNLRPASSRFTEFDNGAVIAEISYYDPKYYNHWFDAEYDLKNKKVDYVSMNG